MICVAAVQPAGVVVARRHRRPPVHSGRVRRKDSGPRGIFLVENGERTGYIFFEAADQAALPTLNEPMFAALDAAIDIIPALTLDDLKRGLAG